MQRDIHLRRWCDQGSVATVLSLALLASGCSAGGGGLGAPAATAPSASAPSSSPSLSQKISNFFSGSTANSKQAVAGAQTEFNCPLIDIRQGASTLTIGPGGDNAAMSLKYQGVFVRAARECSAVGGNMVMRVGVEGRIIVGPAGGPGNVDVPLRIAVVSETTASSKTIVTKLVHIPVTVTSATENPTFTHIEEGLSFPMPSAADLDNYIVYIGFDPLAAEEQSAHKPKAKSKAKPKSRPTASTG